jgi:hypothetical protein
MRYEVDDDYDEAEDRRRMMIMTRRRVGMINRQNLYPIDTHGVKWILT